MLNQIRATSAANKRSIHAGLVPSQPAFLAAPEPGVDLEARGSSAQGARADGAASDPDVHLQGGARVLPKFVRGEELLPTSIDADQWARLPLGRDDRGETVSLNLTSGPCVVFTGDANSGKTIALREIALGALASGFDLIYIDPVKKACGLQILAPWTRGIFTKSVPEAAAVLAVVYEEVRRRVDLIDGLDGETWLDLSAGSVKPLLVVIEEFSNLTESNRDKPRGIPEDHPFMVEWQEMVIAQAAIRALVEKISMEAPGLGVHLILSGQRLNAGSIGTATRANVGTIVEMIVPGRAPSKNELALFFPGHRADDALAEIDALNDGASKGLGIIYSEGSGVQGIRVGFIEKEEISAYCERLEIPLGIPLMIP